MRHLVRSSSHMRQPDDDDLWRTETRHTFHLHVLDSLRDLTLTFLEGSSKISEQPVHATVISDLLTSLDVLPGFIVDHKGTSLIT